MGEFIKTTTYTAVRDGDTWTVTNDETNKTEKVPHGRFMKEYALTPQKKGTAYSPGKLAYVKAKKEAGAAE